MSGEEFTVGVCTACAHALWPPRPVCPRCGSTRFAPRAAARGSVEEVTETGEGAFASVRTDAGPVVIVRLAGEAAAGAAVELHWAAAADGRRFVLATPDVSGRA
ncbi:MAG: zinc ribbon domain-containing protein [Solirubrobacteraceae bacterium]